MEQHPPPPACLTRSCPSVLTIRSVSRRCQVARVRATGVSSVVEQCPPQDEAARFGAGLRMATRPPGWRPAVRSVCGRGHSRLSCHLCALAWLVRLCAELWEVEAAAGFQGAGQSAQQARGQILLTRRGMCVLQRPPRCVLDACSGLSPSLLCIDHRNYNKLRTIFPHSRRLHLRSDD